MSEKNQSDINQTPDERIDELIRNLNPRLRKTEKRLSILWFIFIFQLVVLGALILFSIVASAGILTYIFDNLQ